MIFQKIKGLAYIPNGLFEAIVKSNFNATQIKIILFIIRHTYGVKREDVDMSVTEISKDTSISKSYVKHELNKLIRQNVVIIVKDYADNQSRTFKINNNYGEWNKG